MKGGWSSGFLAPLYQTDTPEEFHEIGEYVAALHATLWRIVRSLNPTASGDLDEHVYIQREGRPDARSQTTQG